MDNIFNMMAKRYDTEERIEIADIITTQIKKQIVDGQVKTALDFGCGTGLVGLPLTEVFQQVLFVDTAANMIEQLQQKLNHTNITNASALHCDLLSDSPPDLQVDYIFMAQVLLHIPDTDLVFNRLYPLLKDDGHLLIVDFDKEEKIVSDKVHNGFKQEDLIRRAKATGFKQTISATFYHGRNIFMNHDASLFLLDCEK